MTRDELIAYLELKAHAFEGHPVHSDLSEALRAAAVDVQWVYNLTAAKPWQQWTEPPRHVPGDT